MREFTVDRQPAYYSVKEAARLLSIPYEELLSHASKLGVLATDSTIKLPLVPTEFLQRFSVFEKAPQLAPSQNLEIPALSKEQWTRLTGIRELRSRLPLETFASIKRGRIETEYELAGMLQFGQWRARRLGAMRGYLLADFFDAMTWASPAEASWRAAVRWLQDMVLSKPSLPKIKAPLDDGYKAFVELKLEERRKLEARAKTDVFRFRNGKTRKGVIEVPEDSLVRYADAEQELPKSALFHFQRQYDPMPAQDHREAWLAAIPLEYLEKALELATAWADALLEDRTGYFRAKNVQSQEEHRVLYQEAREAVYQDRLAWECGILTPLWPRGFRVLF